MSGIRIATDAIVFTVMNDELHLLLIMRKYPPFKGMYAFPGGFVKEDENLEDGVKRELEEETAVKDIFLKQIGTYGDVDRDPRGRVISVSYMALISPEHNISASTDASSVSWFPIDSLPKLGFDHEKILRDALKQLRFEVQTTNIASQILPRRFTLAQLQKLYENILDMELDKRNFRKWVREIGFLRDTGETFMDGAHRPAKLYEFVEQGYTSLKNRISVLIK